MERSNSFGVAMAGVIAIVMAPLVSASVQDVINAFLPTITILVVGGAGFVGAIFQSSLNPWADKLVLLIATVGAFALGVVETARHSNWGYDIRAEVAGAIGKVVVDGERMTPVTHYRDVATESDLYPDFMNRFEVAYRRELEVFFADLGAGRPVGPGPDDAYETLRLAVACTRSWREGRPVKLDEVQP